MINATSLLFYFNPRTPCGVRQDTFNEFFKWVFISIHALHAECDINDCNERRLKLNFTPRTPCGVRLDVWLWAGQKILISIHALHAECDILCLIVLISFGISIHALHAECDYYTF